MKKILIGLIPFIISLFLSTCTGNKKEKITPASTIVTEFSDEGLIIIGKDIITEVVIKPDPEGDPWELEKLKGFNGEPMFLDLLNKITQNAINVYDCIKGNRLTEKEAKKLLRETGSDISKIGKIQFIEDWFFNPSTNEIIKKVKSISLGYESKREEGLPPAYLPYFQVKPEQK